MPQCAAFLCLAPCWLHSPRLCVMQSLCNQQAIWYGCSVHVAENGSENAAVLLQMLIKGIRSFAPENNLSIEFYKPLTLIVGSNGAGKTVRAAAAHD